jgi:hypothetical protein
MLRELLLVRGRGATAAAAKAVRTQEMTVLLAEERELQLGLAQQEEQVARSFCAPASGKRLVLGPKGQLHRPQAAD